MKTNSAGKALIKKWESLRLKAYLCPANVWTIGYGHTGDVKEGMVINSHQADVVFDFDLEKYEDGINALNLKLTENQFSALVSFAFNLGLTALANSTLLKKLRKGDLTGAAAEFHRWNKAGGKVLPGLVARRAEEAALFSA